MEEDQNSRNYKWTMAVWEQYRNQQPAATYFMEVLTWPYVVTVHFYKSHQKMIQKILASSRFRIHMHLWTYSVLPTVAPTVIARSSILWTLRTTSLPWQTVHIWHNLRYYRIWKTSFVSWLWCVFWWNSFLYFTCKVIISCDQYRLWLPAASPMPMQSDNAVATDYTSEPTRN
jgi:hypothetical protein